MGKFLGRLLIIGKISLFILFAVAILGILIELIILEMMILMSL